jgi:Rieske Fe-S protein
MDRRRFLQRIEAVSAGALVGALPASLTGCIGFHYVNAQVTGRRVTVRKDDLGASQFALIDVPGEQLPLYLHRLDDGSWSAVSTRCMHRGCPVEPLAGHLVCPCHGSEYTVTGDVLKGPTLRPLRRYRVISDEQAVHVELDGAPAP